MEKTVIICDRCGKDITKPADLWSDRFTVAREDAVRRPDDDYEDPRPPFLYGPPASPDHFCGVKCLLAWLGHSDCTKR